MVEESTPHGSTNSEETSTIIANLNSLTDIEGDLANAALAVAATTTMIEPSDTDAELKQPSENNISTSASATTEHMVIESNVGTDQVSEEPNQTQPKGDDSSILDQAEALEGILEDAIPDIPNKITSDSSIPQTLNEPVVTSDALPVILEDAAVVLPSNVPSATPAESVQPNPNNSLSTHSAIENKVEQVIQAVEADIDQPILPESVLAPTPAEPVSDNGQRNATGVENGVSTPAQPQISTTTTLPPATTSLMAADTQSGTTADLPAGLSYSSPSVVNNPGLVQAWQKDGNTDSSATGALVTLFEWSIQRTEVIDARAWYETLASSHPTAFKPLLSLINLELALSNFEQVEALFSRALRTSSTLMAAADVNIWKAYLLYIRRQNPISDGPESQRARETVTQAYEVALKECGLDRESGDIWHEYITYVAEAKPKTPWETQQQSDSLRKLYQRAVCIPLNNVETLWKGYDAFENGLNKQTAKKFLAEKSPAYMTARTALRELRSLTDIIPHPSVPPTPNYSDEDRRVVSSWRAYLKWEESNPLAIADPDTLGARIGYAFKKCLAEMRHYPELWYYAASYYQREGKEEGTAFLRAGLQACPKSLLLAFALAEVEEEKRDYAACHTIFESLLSLLNTEIDELKKSVEREVEIARGPDIIGPPGRDNGNGLGDNGEDNEIARLIREREERATLVAERRGRDVQAEKVAASVAWIMYMRFARRSEGLKGGRLIFGKARKSSNITWHIFEASAMMEYYSNKDSSVAIRVFEVGLKLFSEDVDYILAYLSFLLSINDDTNARALFERSAIKIPAETARPLWDAWAEYEYMFGDLTAVRKLESRFATTFPNDSALKRFALKFKYNGLDEIARRDLGFGRGRGVVTTAGQQVLPLSTPVAGSTIPVSTINAGPGIPPPSLAPPSMLPPHQPHLPPFPPTMLGGTPQPIVPVVHTGINSGNPASPLKRDRPDSVDRSIPPSSNAQSHGSKRQRSTVSPPPGGGGGGRRSQQSHPKDRGASRDRDVGMGGGSGRYPPPLVARERSPPRRSQERGYPSTALGVASQGRKDREDLDRSGVTRSLAWFIGSLPSTRSFDGPVFHADDILQLFDNISPTGTALASTRGEGAGQQHPSSAASYPSSNRGYGDRRAGRY